MVKFVCSVCGYVHEGGAIPDFCPICETPTEKSIKQEGEMSWAAEHVAGIAQGAPKDIINDSRMNFKGECSEVGICPTMVRVAHRGGYPEIGMYYEKAVYEEAEHTAKFTEPLGKVVTDSTKKNLEMHVDVENGTTAGKFDLVKRVKALNLGAIRDTVHKMARDEIKHGRTFRDLLGRYFRQHISQKLDSCDDCLLLQKEKASGQLYVQERNAFFRKGYSEAHIRI